MPNEKASRNLMAVKILAKIATLVEFEKFSEFEWLPIHLKKVSELQLTFC